VVQEALTNVIKHASPTCAQVRVSVGARELELEVSDSDPRRSRPSRNSASAPIAPTITMIALAASSLSFCGTHPSGDPDQDRAAAVNPAGTTDQPSRPEHHVIDPRTAQISPGAHGVTPPPPIIQSEA
jgi:hypothetical protein